MNQPVDIGMETALTGLQRRGYVPQTVFDIGAADGTWTRLALKIWKESNFICFEPLAERHAALRQLQSSAGNRVTICPVGIGDTDAFLSLGVTDQLWDSSFAYSGSSSRQVPVKRLDSLVAEGTIPEPSFVKIDVQGFERKVVQGGINTLGHADFVLMECQFLPFCEDMSTLDKTIAYMADMDFIPYEFVDFLRRPLDGAMGQCDILFARRNHPIVSDLRWSA